MGPHSTWKPSHKERVDFHGKSGVLFLYVRLTARFLSRSIIVAAAFASIVCRLCARCRERRNGFFGGVGRLLRKRICEFAAGSDV